MRSDVSLHLMAALLFLHTAWCRSLTAFEVVGKAPSIKFTEESFDQSNFQQLTIFEARKRCEELLQVAISSAEKATVLSPEQKHRLNLAGQIDIHRFFAEYDSRKRKLKFGTILKDQWQVQAGIVQNEIRPLVGRYTLGLHNESSMFAKTLTTALDEHQRAQVREFSKSRARSAYHNYIRMTLANIDSRIPLTRRQRTAIIDVLLQSTDPPEFFGTFTMPLFKVLNQMKLVEDQLRKILTDEEWAALSQLLDAGTVEVK